MPITSVNAKSFSVPVPHTKNASKLKTHGAVGEHGAAQHLGNADVDQLAERRCL